MAIYYTYSGSTSILLHDLCYVWTISAKVTGLRQKSFYVYSSGKADISFEWVEKTNVSGYQYQVYTNAGTPLTTKATTGNRGYLYNIAGNQQYKVRVRSYIDCNGTNVYSTWSPYIYLVPQPEFTTATVTSSGKLQLQWNQSKKNRLL